MAVVVLEVNNMPILIPNEPWEMKMSWICHHCKDPMDEAPKHYGLCKKCYFTPSIAKIYRNPPANTPKVDDPVTPDAVVDGPQTMPPGQVIFDKVSTVQDGDSWTVTIKDDLVPAAKDEVFHFGAPKFIGSQYSLVCDTSSEDPDGKFPAAEQENKDFWARHPNARPADPHVRDEMGNALEEMGFPVDRESLLTCPVTTCPPEISKAITEGMAKFHTKETGRTSSVNPTLSNISKRQEDLNNLAQICVDVGCTPEQLIETAKNLKEEKQPPAARGWLARIKQLCDNVEQPKATCFVFHQNPCDEVNDKGHKAFYTGNMAGEYGIRCPECKKDRSLRTYGMYVQPLWHDDCGDINGNCFSCKKYVKWELEVFGKPAKVRCDSLHRRIMPPFVPIGPIGCEGKPGVPGPVGCQPSLHPCVPFQYTIPEINERHMREQCASMVKSTPKPEKMGFTGVIKTTRVRQGAMVQYDLVFKDGLLMHSNDPDCLALDEYCRQEAARQQANKLQFITGGPLTGLKSIGLDFRREVKREMDERRQAAMEKLAAKVENQILQGEKGYPLEWGNQL